jgi:large subunit ribosomal protein L25
MTQGYAQRPGGSSYNPPPMAGERVKLEVQQRDRVGSRETRRLRRAGLIPGVLYGRSTPHAISVPERDLRRALTGKGGLHAILDVVLEGQSSTHPSILKDYQTDPIRGTLTHIDLHEVRLDQPITAAVTVQLTGEAKGTKEGGVLSQVTREVNVEALPMEIPEHLELDISEMAIGDSLRVADLPPREGVSYLDDPETVLANVAQPRVEEEPETTAAEGAEGEVGEGEGPEGEADGESEADASGDAGRTEG